MSLFSPPKVPNPTQALAQGNQVASDQQGYNAAAQAGSMVNQTNPFGSLTYSQVGTGPNGVPIWNANTSLSPDQQALYDTTMGGKSIAGQQATSLLGGANYGSMSPTDAIGGLSSGLTKDLLDKKVSYLSPFFNTETDRLDTKLRNQGLLPGQPAYDAAMRGNDTNHGLAVTNYLSEAEPQAFQQASQLYNMPAQLAMALGGYGAPTQPNQDFVNAPGMQPANLIGATANSQSALMDQYKAQQQQYSSMMSGIMGIPTAVLGGWAGSPAGGAALTGMFGAMSDRRLKRDITKVGKWRNGLNLYLYRLFNSDAYEVGVMADEVEQIRPWAIRALPAPYHGFKGVDYNAALA